MSASSALERKFADLGRPDLGEIYIARRCHRKPQVRSASSSASEHRAFFTYPGQQKEWRPFIDGRIPFVGRIFASAFCDLRLKSALMTDGPIA